MPDVQHLLVLLSADAFKTQHLLNSFLPMNYIGRKMDENISIRARSNRQLPLRFDEWDEEIKIRTENRSERQESYSNAMKMDILHRTITKPIQKGTLQAEATITQHTITTMVQADMIHFQ